MKSYEIDIKRGLVDMDTGAVVPRTGIEPKPGEVIDFEGTRLIAVEDDGKDCCGCVVNENDYRIWNSKNKCICLSTSCNGDLRNDGKSIHYEEVKDGQ